MNEDVSPIKHGEFSHVICYFSGGYISWLFPPIPTKNVTKTSNVSPFESSQNTVETPGWQSPDVRLFLGSQTSQRWHRLCNGCKKPRFSSAQVLLEGFFRAEKTIGKWHESTICLQFTTVESTSTKETATWNRSLSMIWIIPILDHTLVTR